MISFALVSAVKIRPKEGDTYFDVIAVVDPVTRDAQKLAPLLLVGRRALCHPGLGPYSCVPIVLDRLLFHLWPGPQEAGQRQLARLHELPVETVGDSSEEVRALTSCACIILSLHPVSSLGAFFYALFHTCLQYFCHMFLSLLGNLFVHLWLTVYCTSCRATLFGFLTRCPLLLLVPNVGIESRDPSVDQETIQRSIITKE